MTEYLIWPGIPLALSAALGLIAAFNWTWRWSEVWACVRRQPLRWRVQSPDGSYVRDFRTHEWARAHAGNNALRDTQAWTITDLQGYRSTEHVHY